MLPRLQLPTSVVSLPQHCTCPLSPLPAPSVCSAPTPPAAGVQALTAISSMNGTVVDPDAGPMEVKFANADPASRALQQTPSDNLCGPPRAPPTTIETRP